MKILLSTLAFGLSGVIALNYWVDPGRQWHRGPNDYPPRVLRGDEVWVWPPAMEDHIARWEQIRQIDRPKVVSFGSCRSFVFNSTLFASNAHFFNSGVGEISVYDFVALWQAFKENNKIPKQLLIFLDPWVFNANNGEVNRWGYNAAYIDRFFDQHPTPGTDRRTILYQRLKAPLMMRFARAQKLLHYDTFWRSLKALWKSESLGDAIMAEGSVSVDRRGYRADGSVIHWTQPQALDVLRATARDAGNATPVYNLGRWRLDLPAVAAMRSLLRDLEDHGVKTMIVVTPYHPELYRIIQHRPGYKHVFPELHQSMVSLTSEFARASFCDAIDAAASGCFESDFHGPAALAPSCAEKVLRHCLSSPAWAGILQASE